MKKTMTLNQIRRLIKESDELSYDVETGSDEEPEMPEQSDLEAILNSLLGDEYNAWKQYTMMCIAAKGKSLSRVEDIFKNNGNEEMYDHFENLCKWMQSTDMKPVNDPTELDEISTCPYEKIPREENTATLVTLAIKSENAAIAAYEKALSTDAVKQFPDLVYLLSEFLKDEREHLHVLNDLLTQIEGFDGEEHDAVETELEPEQ